MRNSVAAAAACNQAAVAGAIDGLRARAAAGTHVRCDCGQLISMVPPAVLGDGRAAVEERVAEALGGRVVPLAGKFWTRARRFYRGEETAHGLVDMVCACVCVCVRACACVCLVSFLSARPCSSDTWHACPTGARGEDGVQRRGVADCGRRAPRRVHDPLVLGGAAHFDALLRGAGACAADRTHARAWCTRCVCATVARLLWWWWWWWW